MTIREFEVLLALCKASPNIRSAQSAQRLVHQLAPYILDAHVHSFVPSPYFRNIEPSPTEALAFHTTGALLVLGNSYEDLEDKTAEAIWAFVNACGVVVESIASRQAEDAETSNVEDAVRTATVAVALLGFMDAASAQADFWRAGGRSVEWYSTLITDQMNFLEASADFDQQLATSWQQKMAFAVKASSLIAYLCCAILNVDAADTEVLMAWLEDVLGDPVQMADEALAVTSATNSRTVATAAKCLASVLQMLSKDAIITTLYTLGNVLSPGSNRAVNGANDDLATDAVGVPVYTGQHSTGSSISLQLEGEEHTAVAYGNVVQAICGIAEAVVNAQIITGAAALSLKGGQLEFRSLLKMYSRISHLAVAEKKEQLLNAVMKARCHISANLRPGSPLFDTYWEHLLDTIISVGDVHQSSQTKDSDVQLAAQDIAQLLRPLAVFMASNDMSVDAITEDESHSMLRDAWFNIVVHGFLSSSDLGEKWANELRIMAAAYLVESLRADAGDCTKALSYFLEPSMRGGAVSSTMEALTAAVVGKYLAKTTAGKDGAFTAHCLEEETDLYEPQSIFTSRLGNVTVELSHDYDYRRRTLNLLTYKAKAWVSVAINLASLDVKGLLQTYLSEYYDEGAYGHTSFGRSFAVELGSLIPATDNRLQSIEPVGNYKVNAASDFVAQYTTRQEYRYGETLPDRGMELMSFMHINRRTSFVHSSNDSANAATALAHVEARLLSGKDTPLEEVRAILRRAAALLCRSTRDESAVTHYLVSIPFAMFTKQSIKLGASLWLGVINETPQLEPRLLAEIAQQWELTIQRRLGLFNTAMTHPDPFMAKNEFAPSDLEAIAKQKQFVHNLLSPHAWLIVFLGSHFNATRLGSPNVHKIFLRLIDITVDAWRLKDKILSAGLSWFKHSPRYSFGNNILQVKTELKLLTDVLNALKPVAYIGAHSVGNVRSLQAKEQLLTLLLENEQTRLAVWLNPTDDASKFQTFGPNSSKNALEIRWLLLNVPGKAIDEPGAVSLLLGGMLPDDVNFLQLKHLLYWAPVSPITAITLFMPSYQNHPFIIQYAMRALESHSVDVNFFYVPQIVQTLRYDALGYVERFILETAQFSQLFAHQIIWNMKANSYKDDDAQIEDAIKPTLDSVMNKMLKPLIKRSKPEKKQKIEEELRKIKVEVGVYLPSNPDGVVIGIDRKSGKPLQSHAKAPYMATFRIKKTKTNVDSSTELINGAGKKSQEREETSIETWQSAIFKVGDDCRQDVLALQMIAAFRGIFHNVGLDVYVFPYRVTATAPGCGVIDVLPNSISRDMLGREAVNGLYDYFISKYGNEDSLRFQKARNNFVKSMAAYSMISFLLQFKDRHNGNIMIDDSGHIIHIDFGFCFDIAPGGIRFERAPFKLTSEMVAVMGGNTEHQSFKWFEELCVKAFLASRQYCDRLSQIVLLMMDSGLPCFKPETVKHFRERFVLEKSEREAADFMKDLIKKSYASYSTSIYDQFQLLTNGIPY
ncbi:unnamed protein product [Parascedosporium putredinis]|uniref:1-phosphatidylinositol 4-kinase n=1 Tax=Parascedosporium putredinis TaxID=1442378 RepID=A0A9P1H7U3_9PEZI|nr:unnamed protein product [Parascedosporium putredinis]CAI7999272.1 unnamed protein product [Parascedosporium putredinis]